ncbi:hypothetical protein ACHEXK_08065 [Limnohabitans sp. DCL3]|uniref:hypothetical protein n=1 Tax=Limnohabitans sp. DCL3 TaxID=3374103 RepID=UPI003A88E17A
MSSRPDPRILGHDMPKARLTASGWAWIALYVGLPILLLGNAMDLFFQWTWGWCIGVWCMV